MARQPIREIDPERSLIRHRSAVIFDNCLTPRSFLAVEAVEPLLNDALACHFRRLFGCDHIAADCEGVHTDRLQRDAVVRSLDQNENAEITNVRPLATEP